MLKEEAPLVADEEAYRTRLVGISLTMAQIEQSKRDIPKDHCNGTAESWSLTRAKTAYTDINARISRANIDEAQALFARRDERKRAVKRVQGELQRFCLNNRIEVDDIKGVKLSVSLDEARAQANRELDDAKGKHSVAEHEVEQAQKSLSLHSVPATYRARPDDCTPRTSQHGRELIASTNEQIASVRHTIEQAKDDITHLSNDKKLLNTHNREVENQHKEWLDEAEAVSITSGVQMSATIERSLADFRNALGEYRHCKRRFISARQTRDQAYQAVYEESRHRRWERVDGDKRGAVQQGSDNLSSILDDVLREYHTWRDVIIDTVKRADEAVNQITERLTTLVKSDGLAVINHAQTGSRLPDNIGEWSGRPFVKIELPGTDTRSLAPSGIEPYCKHVVRQILSEEKIFDGRELIIRVLDELAENSGYKVTILKPSHSQTVARHNVTELGSWSDGEIITSAILLYCCIVQARTWHRTGAGRTTRQQSNGILLLDNPFGEANSPDFVRLQVDMAEKLGVQLIYTASGDPRELLAMFRRNNRLYQRHGRDVKHVAVEDADLTGTAVRRGTIGLRNG